MRTDNGMRMRNWLIVTNVDYLNKENMDETLKSRYLVYTIETKMY